MGDPVGAAAHVREALAPAGTSMIVEPNAGDRLEHNLDPVGRVFNSASTASSRRRARRSSGGTPSSGRAGSA